jgi:pantoate--beta-alanine ligase
VRTVTTKAELRSILDEERAAGKTIAFVPTMGALHEGHMNLIRKAGEMAGFVVASVFVNPTQFNNSDDLDKYPRTPEKDAALLEKNGCDLVFFPSVEEMYPEGQQAEKVELGGLATVMEGSFRPGHFDGVTDVVSRFFRMVQPDMALFGRKDFQQLAVIREMVKQLRIPVKVVGVDTSRESSGLARSSRNMRLSEEEKEKALIIYKTLVFARELARKHSPSAVRMIAKQQFDQSDLRLEYFEIVHPDTLQPLQEEWVEGAVACIAAYCGEVRLIDNMILKA